MKKKPTIRVKTALHATSAAKRLPTPAQAGAWVALLVFALLTLAALTGRNHIVTPELAASSINSRMSNPSELSGVDIARYSEIFSAEKTGDHARSDALMAQLDNRYLVGYALAMRYLSSDYNANAKELSDWLSHYSDHPHAMQVARLAIQRGADVTLPKTVKPLQGEGYSDHLGRSTMPDGWFSALGFWREGDYKTSNTIFTQLAQSESLNDWQHAAAYYWAYRTNSKLGATNEARSHLMQAATYPTTFYGLLANAQMGEAPVVAEAPEVSDSLRNDPRAIRAALLVALDDAAAAEDELRALYSSTSSYARTGIVTLASELGLPNFQMRLARTPGLSPAEQLFAQYPMPYYMVHLHGVMDSALLMAVARNESGFREVAQSEAGATGLMQILPSTAKMIEKKVGHDRLQVASSSGDMSSLSARLNDPAMSARYGAEYLNMLANIPAIRSNLIHLLVGYNAGPGTLISWKAAAKNVNDPLLFIESIPYAETRNYVMQVSAQYWIYQMMMDESPTTLAALAKGQWPVVKAGV